MNGLQKTLIELDKLKTIYRHSYVSDGSRKENSAEHSWHLAMTFMALKEILPSDFRVDHAMRLALVHDICEIGAGDVSVFSPARGQQSAAEKAYIDQFATDFGTFGAEVSALWHEFQARETIESIWANAFDRLMPFLLNIANDGQSWKEEGIKRSQVMSVNKIIFENVPELGEWMLNEIEHAVQNGWLQET